MKSKHFEIVRDGVRVVFNNGAWIVGERTFRCDGECSGKVSCPICGYDSGYFSFWDFRRMRLSVAQYRREAGV